MQCNSSVSHSYACNKCTLRYCFHLRKLLQTAYIHRFIKGLYAHLIFPPYQLSIMQDINCKSCLAYIYADIALKEGKQSIQMAPTLLYYGTALFDLEVHCPSCQLVFYKQSF